MKNISKILSLLISLIFGTFSFVFAIDTKDTRLLSQPAVSADHIAFIYAQDLWVANLDGTQPRRLTVSDGVESSPVFSPDGKLIAFSAQHDGNTDVYVVPVEGGLPKRLTWHPGVDFVRGFTPDGKSVLFGSQRNSFTNRYAQFYTVPVSGGPATQLELPNAFFGTYSPDGKYMAYTPAPDVFKQWKHYRGGATARIWLYSLADKSIVELPKPATGANDTQPVWIGNNIFYRSDRNGEFNLFCYDVTTKQVKQLTNYKDFPVLNISGGNGKIIYEQAGYLHLFDLATATDKKLTIGIAADLFELRPRYVKGAKYIRSAGISPSGARVVFDFRGEIVTVPAEKGDVRNITNTTGAHEEFPSWSPDGKSIAYFSDASGEYQLAIQAQDGKGDAKFYKLNGTGFYTNPRWSPDSKKIAFSDNGRNFYILDVASGVINKIDADEIYTPGTFRDLFGDWSSDSRWIAYTKVISTQYRRVFLYDVNEQKSYALTDGLSDATEPNFSRDGKYLYFFASTDAGPVLNWFDQSSIDMRRNSSIYLVTLQQATTSPLAKESDEESSEAKKEDKPEVKAAMEKKGATAAGLQIDWAGIQDRILDIPIAPGSYSQLGVGADGEIYYIVATDGGSNKLHKYDFKKRSDEEVTAADGYTLSAGGKKMLLASGGVWSIVNSGEKPSPGKNVNVDAIEIKVDPAAEWAEIFDEAWRVNRDYFYDPAMHGIDWPAMKKKYAAFLPDLTCRDDLNSVMQWMFSELVIGHHFILNTGDHPGQDKMTMVKGGLLGADYAIVNNRYRIQKIYGGLNWNPNLRSPLTEPGVNVHAGEYLLAVNGKDVQASDEIYQYFENTAGTLTEITVGPNPNYTGSRVVKVVPVENEYDLRNRDWVEGNLKKVTEATNGQVAYVYVPNTAEEGHDYFKRYFYPQANRKAIIVDERFNGGGDIADYYINILQNPYQANWHLRYGAELKTPSASIQGPKVMLINESAGSGGDMLPWMFRKFNVGTLVGTRTWGGLVGILGYPDLLDGGMVTAPNVGIWTKDGFIVENVGVAPDVEVIQTPADMIKGVDPQLQKAIEIALEQLKKNPPVEPVRPPLPVKAQ